MYEYTNVQNLIVFANQFLLTNALSEFDLDTTSVHDE